MKKYTFLLIIGFLSTTLSSCENSQVQISYELIDVVELAQQYKLPLDDYKIIYFDASDNAKTFVFVMKNRKDRDNYRLYKHDELLYETKKGELPSGFRDSIITDDGHVIHSFTGDRLFIDDLEISPPQENISKELSKHYYTSSVYYNNGTVIYHEKNYKFDESESVWRYDVTTKQGTKLYEEKGSISNLNVVNPESIFYFVKSKNEDWEEECHVYKNGTPLYKLLDGGFDQKKGHIIKWFPCDDPQSHLFTSQQGDVYFFTTEKENTYALRKNNIIIFEHEGQGSFVYEDDNGSIWHIGVISKRKEENELGYDSSFFLYKDQKLQNQHIKIANASHLRAQNNNYALAILPEEEYKNGDKKNKWRLLKNGKLTGENFPYGSFVADNTGLHFGPNGKVYLRSLKIGEDINKSRYSILEDGVKIFEDTFNDYFAVRANKDRVYLYGIGRQEI